MNPESNKVESLTVATFNVSMEAGNYLPDGEKPGRDSRDVLLSLLAEPGHEQIATIAAIIQRVRPDVLLLNEFDYTTDPALAVARFNDHYLNRAQRGAEPIHYPYFYTAPVNTGVLFPHDLNGDGRIRAPEDTYGFGHYPGQYGMVLLSRYPIDSQSVRTFRRFKWRDMPNALKPVEPNGEAYYREAAWAEMRLSSKSHWDIPVLIEGKRVHILASHPTPPVFDGPEDRNGRRNHDEIRLWHDYIGGSAPYLYDDNGAKGALAGEASFVLVGDLNASPHEGDGRQEAIRALLAHPRVTDPRPTSPGGQQARPTNPYSDAHTAAWGMRADYVLPSSDLTVLGSGVYWPAPTDPMAPVVASRRASSDHRLVWAELAW